MCYLILKYTFSVLKVLDWLANHGEVFIRKNTGIGRNLQKARVYQKSPEHFENVAQVSDLDMYITLNSDNNISLKNLVLLILRINKLAGLKILVIFLYIHC